MSHSVGGGTQGGGGEGWEGSGVQAEGTDRERLEEVWDPGRWQLTSCVLWLSWPVGSNGRILAPKFIPSILPEVQNCKIIALLFDLLTLWGGSESLRRKCRNIQHNNGVGMD